MKSFFYKFSAVILGSVLMFQVVPMLAFAVSDTVPPTVSITAPINGATVSGMVSVLSSATDISIPSTDCVITVFGVLYDVTALQDGHSGGNVFTCGADQTTLYQSQHGTNVTRIQPYLIPQAGISRVELYVDGLLVATDSSAPYSFSWNSSAAVNGPHTLVARAYDLANNQTNSSAVTITSSNTVTTGDAVLPTAVITLPLNNATASGTISIAATASDNVGVTKVEFYADGVLISTDTSSAYTSSWNTNSVANGSHSLIAKAYDAVGNIGVSPTIIVTVNNVGGTRVSTGDDEDEQEEHGSVNKDNEEHRGLSQNSKAKNHRYSKNDHHKSRSQTIGNSRIHGGERNAD